VLHTRFTPLAAFTMLPCLLGCAVNPALHQPETPPPPKPREVLIERLDVQDLGEDSLLRISTSGPLVWDEMTATGGALIVTLPDSRFAPAVTSLYPTGSLIANVEVTQAGEGGDVNRLLVVTSEPASHTTTVGNQVLALRFTPNRALPLPAARVRPAAPIAATVPPSGGDARPRPAASPAAKAAGALLGVEILETGEQTVILIRGDGAFSYTTFDLEDPHRFIVDLSGVLYRSATAETPASGEHVQRVRIGQFRPPPEPITRVVFDLLSPLVPQLEQTAEGLRVRFGDTTTTNDRR
jgi:hypothetical protein